MISDLLNSHHLAWYHLKKPKADNHLHRAGPPSITINEAALPVAQISLYEIYNDPPSRR
jgi:PIN domain nuclease of toxin-antitoxin system